MTQWIYCGTAFGALAISAIVPGTVAAMTIDKFFQIQPIQICDDAGANCAPVPLSQTFTEDVYTQAGVAAIFLPTTQVNDSSLLTVDGVADLNQPGNGQSSNALALNTWFAQSLNAAPGFVLYGEAYIDGNGAAINGSAVQAANREDTVAHELAHNLNLPHSSSDGPDNLVEPGSTRNVPADDLSADQIDTIRNSQFVQDVPEVTVDMTGATPFATDDFFDVAYTAGPNAAFLSRLTIDLSPVNAFFDPTDAQPGLDGSPLGFGLLDGLGLGDITVNGLSDGSQMIELLFADGAFGVGDGISFGSDIDLFSNVDGFGATPEQLVGAIFDFEFDIGLSLSSVLDDDLVTSSANASQVTSIFGQPKPFGPQLGPGQIGATGPLDPDPVIAPPIPLPAGVWALLGALGALVGATRRRQAAA